MLRVRKIAFKTAQYTLRFRQIERLLNDWLKRLANYSKDAFYSANQRLGKRQLGYDMLPDEKQSIRKQYFDAYHRF